MLSTIIFALGRSYGYIQCQNKAFTDNSKRIKILRQNLEEIRLKRLIKEQNEKLRKLE